MINIIFKEALDLKDDKLMAKQIAEGCDIQCLGIKIKDLKMLIKKYQLKNNNELAITLVDTKIYDLMYLGFMIMNPSEISSDKFIKWMDYTTYYKIRIHSLSYAMSEHKDYEFFLNYLKVQTDDRHLSMYYATLAGRIIIDPNYNHKLLKQESAYIKNNINTNKFDGYNYTKYEMVSLLGYIGMQIPEMSLVMIDYYNIIAADLKIDSQRRLANQADFIKACINRNTLGKSRKSARC